MVESGGTRANRTGQNLESFIEELVKSAGYRFIDQVLFPASQCLEQPIYTKQRVAGKDIYGKNHKVDFYLYHPRKWVHSLVIESKWQQARGSVEEKLPFLVLSIQLIGIPTIVILDGKGYSPGAREWLKSHAGVGSLEQVLDMSEFQRFVNNGRL